MKPKQLAIMAIVLVGLVVAGVVLKQDDGPPPLSAQAELVRLVPEAVTVETVNAIVLAVGDKEPDVRLERKDGEWVIATAWNAPARTEKVESFVKSLSRLRGEFQSDTKDVFGDYGVKDDQALKIRIFVSGSDKPVAELLVGKTRGNDAVFVRQSDGEKVYSAGANLRSEVGLWGDDLAKAPGHRTWLQTDVAEVEKSKLRSVALEYPDHALTLKATTTGAKENGDAADGETADPRAGEGKTTWSLASGGPGKEPKSGEIDRLVEAWTRIGVSDVVDPAQRKKLGLEKPNYRATLTRVEGAPITVAAFRTRKLKKIYLEVSTRPGQVYSVSSWSFERLFPKGSSLFDLETPTLAKKDDVTALEFTRNDITYRLEKTGEKKSWTLTTPETGFPLKAKAATDALAAFADWSAESYADPQGLVKYGLSMPVCTVKAIPADGEAKAFSLMRGADHPALKGAYVAADPKRVLVMAEEKASAAFPELKDLLDLSRLVEAKAGDVTAIAIHPAGKPALTLTRGPEDDKGKSTWNLKADGKNAPADPGKVDAYVRRLLGAGAEDLLSGDAAKNAFGKDDLEPVVLTLKEGQVVLEFGKAVDGGRALRVSTRKAPVVVESGFAADAVAGAEQFAPPPAGPQAPGAGGEAKTDAAADMTPIPAADEADDDAE